MLIQKLTTTTIVTCLAFGIGCFEQKTTDPIKRPSEQAVQTQQPEQSTPQLVQAATKALASGDYETAFELSAKICKSNPDNFPYLMFRGRVCFAAGKMAECIEAYDNVVRLRPSLEPQLWQRGLALYYADRFEAGVKQFETHQTVNSQDVENAVWHLLCAARISDVDQARKKLIPISGDTRVPMSQIYEMFAGRMTPDDVLASANKTSARVAIGSDQMKLQRYYAHLYIGLYHEMLGEPAAAKSALEKAVEINPLDKTNFMGQVARVHLALAKKTGQQGRNE